LSAPVTLVTERLTLRPPSLGDVDAIVREVSDDRIARWTTSISHPYPPGAIDDFLAMVEDDRAAGDGWTFAMIERSSDVVGMVRLDRTDLDDTGEIGYWVAIDRWGRGYATEASRRILTYGFDDLGFRRVRTYIMPANEPSRRVLTKLGFVPDGHGPVEAPARGGPVAMDFLLLERRAWMDHA